MSTMTYGEAIREAMSIRMRQDPNIVLFGEAVGAFGGCFGVSAGMFEEFGADRVRDTPISEGAIIGSAVGSAATGLRPIAELMFNDFLTVGMDQLANQADHLTGLAFFAASIVLCFWGWLFFTGRWAS